jgi:hypothetical protein
LRQYFGRGDDRVTAAAHALGVGRQRVYTLLERHPELARLRSDAARKPGGSDRVPSS